jgi:hypothetical protein
MIINKRNEKSKGGNFAKGKKAVAIDDRTGFKMPYKEMVFEPGTNYFVHEDESDKNFSLVSHPQNYPPKQLVENVTLKHAYPDTDVSVAAVSIGALYPI